MKERTSKNKGFTLIELLAVIVILAVIALIATPLIMRVINNARKNSSKDNAYGFEISEYTNITRGINKIPFVRTIDINVDYFKDTWYNLVGRKKEEYYDKYKSIIMFSFDEEQLKSLKDDDEYMKKIKKDVTELNQDPEFYQWLTDEEDREFLYNSRVIRYKREGIEEGTRQGIEQGTKEKEIEIVRNMKEMNYPVEDIKKITGLSKEEIEKI